MLVVADLNYCLPNGDILFRHLSFSCTKGITALVGRNGIGKSTLLQCIAQGEAGVSTTGSCLWLQQNNRSQDPNARVIDTLGLGCYYDALQRVNIGQPLDTDIDTLTNYWDINDRAQYWLTEANLPLALDQPIAQLSGGQQTKLKLIAALNHTADILLLDEPSNHLDLSSTQWLIQQLQQSSKTVLIVSHDPVLLDNMQRFLVLDETGITPYHTDFPQLRQLLVKQRQETARAIEQTKAQWQREQKQQQQRKEKALKRQQQGESKRSNGSQPKMVMDRKQDKAQQKNGSQQRLSEKRLAQQQEQLRQYQSQQTQLSNLSLQFTSADKGNHRVLDAIAAILPFGNNTPLTFSLDRGERLRLQGDNGCGKSTLIRCIVGQQALASGEIQLHGDFLYLDQHLSLLDAYPCPVELLQQTTPLDSSTARTLLGSIGLRGDRALLPSATLSGGERMKVALLLISQLSPGGLLILDETDNHLDLESQEQLKQTLSQYQGALIFVTHQPNWLDSDKLIQL
ncbi:ABC-F family ATP-binding cassette domain-containing protein [Maribrevibacterium harenarium]|uniref:ABC-F family ATP-binding cassette domain-containing protein n=1 Tax=Maribrevibacterium harenarium TaxID=2589817 RepID=A0A501X3B5_9GAMM|nr:ATP-binding cassette domain-containing protein [Maribrevibacterium harenarium]TPE54995.1 ABC-F family ATP-binding cassette domain-containing protein [Maribrevibacterium harenarium]